ncbi:hypothetical protein NLU13_4789 [Sarocladium strictum]|uniref:Linoleate diol synthase n=1 Tax=Sarocladium strictum TaxID=5046 RepID=A0AA39L8I4_SARSR|nr:hypothetical protein NLU13_4789 [Sarocladium strictum]
MGSIHMSKQEQDLMELTLQVKNRKENDNKYAKFRGDNLIGNQIVPKTSLFTDITTVLQPSNWGALKRTIDGFIKGKGIDGQSLATIAGSLSNYSVKRQELIDSQVKDKYDKMLHPPLTYLGDAFQYRTADGKFNSVLHPHLGQAGAPYAKTVPSKTAPLGALPDPSDLFDRLMMREEGGRKSESGLSAMLIYHATIIIHDIFRTNDNDKNISDSSSYLDLSPLYGYTKEMQRKVRDGRYKLGLLKPDTFAEDRLLRQPPGVCIMLVMYNRYHNYAARQLARINENGRFSVPKKYGKTKLVSLVYNFVSPLDKDSEEKCKAYEKLWKKWEAAKYEPMKSPRSKRSKSEKAEHDRMEADRKAESRAVHEEMAPYEEALELLLQKAKGKSKDREAWENSRKAFEAQWDAAWTKLDDDLFNTARLITCGVYIQISVHDYLRALMGFHQFDTNFTLDPRADFDQKKTTRGMGNQVTVEFNLLYRFHCAISLKDEAYTEEYMKKKLHFENPRDASLPVFLQKMGAEKKRQEAAKEAGKGPDEPWEVTFGIPDDPENPTIPASESKEFKRDPYTNLFDDKSMVDSLLSSMDDPISNFGPRNTPKCLKAVEIMGILQARKWEVGTLNDFREFFDMYRHETFESVTKNVEIQNALRDLYEHPDKIELYPGIFCESDEYMGLDPGPRQSSSALWTAIFSDAITLVRSDRFYTVDWNTNSLTSWGMKEVTPDNDICKTSVFHRLIQRAFPGWFTYDTVRFFHPFYTAEQNAAYAKAQGYGPQFRETQQDPGRDPQSVGPRKPLKPIYLNSYADIMAVLTDKRFVNPALYHKRNLPKAVAEVLDSQRDPPTLDAKILNDHVLRVEPQLKDYINKLMRFVVKRESVAMTNSTFQIDATRDFAIPVVTRYVADFLGFGDKLRTVSNLANSYTENEIYQHITNCQVFLSYNADETKLMKRRNAFKTSMAFLTDLTQSGSIVQANQWAITQALFGKKPTNPMSELGVYVAKLVLDYEGDSSRAAAILLLICLDFAYHSVISFTAVLDEYMKELYQASLDGGKAAEPKWIEIQRLAFSTDSDEGDKILGQKVRAVAQAAVRMPVVRKVRYDPGDKEVKIGGRTIKAGETVILDIASLDKVLEPSVQHNGNVQILESQLSIADKYGVFQPVRLGILALNSMVKFIAQMKNPRRGHDAQGKLKKVRIDESAEGYANYMAPMRVERIRVQTLPLPKDARDKIFSDDVLRPTTDTYLTPNWDEMVPFPMTWKIRFDGFGHSDYRAGDNPYGRVVPTWLPDSMPPFYQPQGPSTTGGTFGDPEDTHEHKAEAGHYSTGCGMGVRGAH